MLFLHRYICTYSLKVNRVIFNKFVCEIPSVKIKIRIIKLALHKLCFIGLMSSFNYFLYCNMTLFFKSLISLRLTTNLADTNWTGCWLWMIALSVLSDANVALPIAPLSSLSGMAYILYKKYSVGMGFEVHMLYKQEVRFDYWSIHTDVWIVNFTICSRSGS